MYFQKCTCLHLEPIHTVPCIDRLRLKRTVGKVASLNHIEKDCKERPPSICIVCTTNPSLLEVYSSLRSDRQVCSYDQLYYRPGLNRSMKGLAESLETRLLLRLAYGPFHSDSMSSFTWVVLVHQHMLCCMEPRGVTRTFRAPVQKTMKDPPDPLLRPFPLGMGPFH